MKATATETKKVLVVDDQETVCESVLEILRRRGYDADGALDADTALTKLDEQSYDLVVADLMMPRRSGMDLLREVRQSQARKKLPFVMITGYATIPSAVEAAKLGVTEYLPKPFTPDELGEVTERALAEKIEFPTFRGQIDADLPFDRTDLTQTAQEYPDRLTRSDVALLSEKFCSVGRMECARFARKGACEGICVILAKKAERAGERIHLADVVNGALDEDLPFNRAELESATSQSYLEALDQSGMPRLGNYQSTRIGKRVLVVESDRDLASQIRSSLTRSGYVVEQAFDAEAARRALGTGKFDLVITEQQLPGGDGMDLVRQLRTARSDVGVIMVSSYASIDSAVEAIRAGADEYAERPQQTDEIREMADRALRAAVR